MLDIIRKEAKTKPISLKGVVEGKTRCKEIFKDLEGDDCKFNFNDPHLD